MSCRIHKFALVLGFLTHINAGVRTRIADQRALQSVIDDLVLPFKSIRTESSSQYLQALAALFLTAPRGMGLRGYPQANLKSRLGMQMLDGAERKILGLTRRQVGNSVTAAILGYDLFTLLGPGYTSRLDVSSFRRLATLQTQYIAALGDPGASSGVGADKWGLWEKDPGPRGVKLKDLESKLVEGRAPAGWSFDPSRWWLEEHGLLMESPPPLPLQRRYLVSGGRETTSVLTVHSDGRWELDRGTLYDVTHLPCRAAVYTKANNGACKPTKEAQKLFPVQPGAKMPQIAGCETEDWQVLFVIGVEA